MDYNEIRTDLVINKMTKAKYEELLASNQINDNEIYYIIDDNDKFYLKSEVYNKKEINDLLANYTPGGGGGGSNVIANVELDGGEDILESIQIDDTKYTLQGQDMTFSDTTSLDPAAKTLRTIKIGYDDWKVDQGSVVVPNIELHGDEPVLESVQIDDATFTLKGEEMIFSESVVEGATPLKSIILGDDVWGIPEGSSGGGSSVEKYGPDVISAVSTNLTSSSSGYDFGYRYSLEFKIPNYTNLDELTEIKIIVKDKYDQYNERYRYLIFELVKYTEPGHSFSLDTTVPRKTYWPSNAGTNTLNNSYDSFPTVFLDLNGVNGTVKIYGANYGLTLAQVKIYR